MQLKDYIQGNRRGKEANRLEREAMNDPFLQDALDGFDSVDGDHAKIIEQLEEEYLNPSIAHQSNKRRFFYWAAAASVLLLIGFGVYFLREENSKRFSSFAETLNPSPIQSHNSTVPQSVDSSVLESEYAADKSKSELLLAEKAVEEVAPTPEKAAIANKSSANDVAVIDTHSVSLSDKSSIAEVVNKEQKQTIHGKIVDEIGEPLIGVSIVEKGTQNGTATSVDGTFALQLPAGDSSNLIASYIGYESQEINPSITGQTVTLKQSNTSLDEVVVVGYNTQKKTTMTGAVSNALEGRVAGVSVENDKSTQSTFGEKEFQAWCQQRADKNVCAGKGASVKVSFFIDENGRPSKIEYKKYSCEDAKNEMEDLLSSSPAWTKITRKITMTVKW